jgi:hypothetical protein
MERVTEKISSFARLFSSNLLEAEVRSALRRERVPHSDPIELLRRIDWVFPDRPLTREYAAVLSAGFLRGADLWHLACTLYLRDSHDSVELVSLDHRQIEVGKQLSLVSN